MNHFQNEIGVTNSSKTNPPDIPQKASWEQDCPFTMGTFPNDVVMKLRHSKHTVPFLAHRDAPPLEF